MPENPLLPHRRLKALYALMQRLHKHASSQTSAESGAGALLAATYVQLESGDVLCAWNDAALQAVAPRVETKLKTTNTPLCIRPLRDFDTPQLCETLSLGLKAATTKRSVVAHATSSSNADWSNCLKRAQTERLPLVLSITEAAASAKKKNESLSWSAVSKLAKRLHVPTITVDAEDAVAIYRTMQESLHRAKLGDGPTIIWCAYPTGLSSASATRSIANMQQYLADRKLLPRSR